jgi:hypothetical protein
LKYRTRGCTEQIEGIAVGAHDNDAATGTAHTQVQGASPPRVPACCCRVPARAHAEERIGALGQSPGPVSCTARAAAL